MQREILGLGLIGQTQLVTGTLTSRCWSMMYVYKDGGARVGVKVEVWKHSLSMVNIGLPLTPLKASAEKMKLKALLRH